MAAVVDSALPPESIEEERMAIPRGELPFCVVCRRRARWLDDETKPVCGYHRPETLARLRERLSKSRKKKKHPSSREEILAQRTPTMIEAFRAAWDESAKRKKRVECR